MIKIRNGGTGDARGGTPWARSTKNVKKPQR